MKNIIYKYRKTIIIIYLILTFIKFFTVRIDRVREEDPTIYFKLYPSIENQIIGVVEDGQLKDYYNRKYPWYEEGQYWEILHSSGGMQDFVGISYNVFLGTWWVMSGLLVLFALYRIADKPEH